MSSPGSWQDHHFPPVGYYAPTPPTRPTTNPSSSTWRSQNAQVKTFRIVGLLDLTRYNTYLKKHVKKCCLKSSMMRCEDWFGVFLEIEKAHRKRGFKHLHRDCQAILGHREISTVATHLGSFNFPRWYLDTWYLIWKRLKKTMKSHNEFEYV